MRTKTLPIRVMSILCNWEEMSKKVSNKKRKKILENGWFRVTDVLNAKTPYNKDSRDPVIKSTLRGDVYEFLNAAVHANLVERKEIMGVRHFTIPRTNKHWRKVLRFMSDEQKADVFLTSDAWKFNTSISKELATFKFIDTLGIDIPPLKITYKQKEGKLKKTTIIECSSSYIVESAPQLFAAFILNKSNFCSLIDKLVEIQLTGPQSEKKSKTSRAVAVWHILRAEALQHCAFCIQNPSDANNERLGLYRRMIELFDLHIEEAANAKSPMEMYAERVKELGSDLIKDLEDKMMKREITKEKFRELMWPNMFYTKKTGAFTKSRSYINEGGKK